LIDSKPTGKTLRTDPDLGASGPNHSNPGPKDRGGQRERTGKGNEKNRTTEREGKPGGGGESWWLISSPLNGGEIAQNKGTARKCRGLGNVPQREIKGREGNLGFQRGGGSRGKRIYLGWEGAPLETEITVGNGTNSGNLTGSPATHAETRAEKSKGSGGVRRRVGPLTLKGTDGPRRIGNRDERSG